MTVAQPLGGIVDLADERTFRDPHPRDRELRAHQPTQSLRGLRSLPVLLRPA